MNVNVPVFSLISHKTLKRAGFILWQLRACFLKQKSVFRLKTTGTYITSKNLFSLGIIGLYTIIYISFPPTHLLDICSSTITGPDKTTINVYVHKETFYLALSVVLWIFLKKFYIYFIFFWPTLSINENIWNAHLWSLLNSKWLPQDGWIVHLQVRKLPCFLSPCSKRAESHSVITFLKY